MKEGKAIGGEGGEGLAELGEVFGGDGMANDGEPENEAVPCETSGGLAFPSPEESGDKGDEKSEEPTISPTTYDSVGRRTQITKENGGSWTYGYNSRSEVTSGSRKFSGGSVYVPGAQFTYAFDDIGNRVSAGKGGTKAAADLMRSAIRATDSTNTARSRTPGACGSRERRRLGARHSSTDSGPGGTERSWRRSFRWTTEGER